MMRYEWPPPPPSLDGQRMDARLSVLSIPHKFILTFWECKGILAFDFWSLKVNCLITIYVYIVFLTLGMSWMGVAKGWI